MNFLLVVTDPPYGLNFMGKEWDKALPPKEAFKEMYRVLKPGALAFVMSSPRQDLVWRMCALLDESGFELSQSFISWIYKTGFPKAYDVSKGIDKKIGLERETTYIEPFGREGRKSPMVGFGRDGFQGGELNNNLKEVSKPNSDDAKEWEGWKAQTGLKPALEPILMVNKPFSESTIVDNVLRWGTGAINVDACRIPFAGQEDFNEAFRENRGKFSSFGAFEGLDKNRDTSKYQKGRFPANLLVSDVALDDGEVTKSGDLLPHHNLSKDEKGARVTNVYGKYTRLEENFMGDEGGKSRYFDLDAWAKHRGFLDVAKPDTSERGYGVNVRNTHPTVKPIKLMAYLIELGCPKNGVVVDPFVGSGTTCIAAKRLCRRYIGIELNEEYHALAVSRVAAYPQPLEWFGENVRKRERT
jgi:site-specific DNA-methyltransferase (adenine-specific)